MKILLVPSSFWPNVGGVEEVTRNVCQQLLRSGHCVVVATNKWPKGLPDSDSHFGFLIQRFSFLVPDPVIKSLMKFVFSGPLEVAKFIRFVYNHKPDVVHCICCSTNLVYCVIVAKLFRIPLVVSSHGEIGMDAKGVYQKDNFLSRSTKYLLVSADVVTGCSENTCNEVEKYSPGVSCVILRNGISVSEFTSAPGNLVKPYVNEKMVFAIGRLVEQKGFDLLLAAWKQVTYPLATLVIAGDGPELSSLKQLVADYGLKDTVRFVGFVDRHELAAYFHSATMFVLPSRHEPFGLVVLEAMASRIPVIAYAVGGVPEFVIDGKNGILVTPNSVDHLAEKITNVLNGNYDESMISAGYETATNRDWTIISSEYLTLYYDLVGQPKQS